MNPRRYFTVAAMLFVAMAESFSADASSAAQAVKEVATRFQEAWNRHDMDLLAAQTAEDVTFVNVGGQRLNGRKEFKDTHTELHKVVMAQSVLSTRKVDVKFIRPDIAIAHWEWSMIADRDRDGAARPPREGIFTWVLERKGESWLIVAAQNTNKLPPPPPAK